MMRSLATVGGFTLMSRVLGFVRDMVISRYLGVNIQMDAWVVAFRFPNLFRRVFGEGAFNAAFVPLYSRKLEEEGDQKADLFAARTVTLMALILIVLAVLAYIFMGPIISLISMGYVGERYDLAVTLSRITTVYLVFVCLMAAFSGMLNSRRVFGPPAFAYVILNIVFLIGLLGVVPEIGQPEVVLSWSVVIAGVLQLGWVLLACWRRGIRIRPAMPKMDNDIKKLGLLMLPGLASAGVQQLNLLVGSAVASFQVAGPSYLYFSDRVNQLPLGLIGVAFGIVLLPEITRNLRAGKVKTAKSSLAHGIEMSLLLSLPAMVAMLIIPEEIMHGLFQGGKFTNEAAYQAGLALRAFAIGAPAYILARVLQTAYFAREDTRTPMRYTMVSALVNIVLSIGLFVILKHVGCALATSIAGWVNVILLIITLRKSQFLKMEIGFTKRLMGMLLASLVMGAGVWFLSQWAAPWLKGDYGLLIRLSVLGLIVGAGMMMYGALVLLLRATSLAELKAGFRRA
ncbi:MAG: murein biosynthesis integral membrane protein MurJ [Verrucomicrobiales bacterium]|nr:murein biosynthesis integral membrane protein MurJ [Verrucomicrobiales bacterium]